jgi:hypothetical protein
LEEPGDSGSERYPEREDDDERDHVRHSLLSPET